MLLFKYYEISSIIVMIPASNVGGWLCSPLAEVSSLFKVVHLTEHLLETLFIHFHTSDWEEFFGF
jgi:hypothetical protein